MPSEPRDPWNFRVGFMTCSQCGQPVYSTDHVCPQPFPPVAPPSPPAAREPETKPKPWSGEWNNWIAPFHHCPRCGASLNWTQHEDALERPLINAEHCGVHHAAMLKWRAGGGL